MARTILGLVAGALLLASGLVHSILGWRALRGQLEGLHASPDLIFGIRAGWLFGGVAMLCFGAIVCDTFLRRRRDPRTPLGTVSTIAVVYLAFGGWALVASGLDPFFLVFLVPGGLLAAASWPGRSRG